MKFHIITVFPELFDGPFRESILKRAQEKELLEIELYNLRDFATDKHHQVDDYPYGGGPGMILKPDPIFRCLDHVSEKIPADARSEFIFLTPQGQQYKQNMANELVEFDHIVLLCGHYKGVDERVREHWKMREISVGDYVLTGGEIPALIIVDTVTRLIPGVISDLNSAFSDSFYNGLLDCPYYTRPEVYRGMKVPDVLLSGNHAEIDKWRNQKSMERTLERREDLINDHGSDDDAGGQ